MTLGNSTEAVRILLVEDNAADAVLVQTILSRLSIPTLLHTVCSADEAIQYLKNLGTSQASYPSMILLDLNLPGKPGSVALEYIKSHRQFAPIPVIAVSSSSSEKDLLAVYQLHANAYIRKPLELHQYSRIIEETIHYWTQTVTTPKKDQNEKLSAIV